MQYGMLFQKVYPPLGFTGFSVDGITTSGIIYGSRQVSFSANYTGTRQFFQEINGGYSEKYTGFYSTYVNDAGVIAGTAYDVPTGRAKSSVIINGTSYSINMPNASAAGTTINDLNNSGQIVGSYVDSTSQTHGYIYSKGIYTDVFFPGSSSTQALSISDSGIVAGRYAVAGGQFHGFVETNGKYTDVFYPGSSSTAAYGVDAAGNIFGTYYDANNKSHGFIDRAGVFSSIDFPGATSTTVSGVNSSGQAVGEKFPFGNGDGGYTVSFVPTVFGTVTTDLHSGGGQVYALYDGILGRAPDTLGLEYYADQIAHGVAPATLATNFLASPEGQARLGATDNTAFIQQLYHNTLHRDADSAGLQYHLNELAHGASRVDVADNFVFSPEHLSNLQPTLNLGLFVPDAQASEVARVYYTMLGRAPDAGGLAYYVDQLDHGGTAASIAQNFLNSPESQATYGMLSNSAYVDALYVNALGRHAESDGLNFWVNALDHGQSRADLAVNLSQSAEAQNHQLANIQQGWHLA